MIKSIRPSYGLMVLWSLSFSVFFLTKLQYIILTKARGSGNLHIQSCMKYKVIVHFEELEIASEFIDSKN